MKDFFRPSTTYIMPPEVIKQYGDSKDWKNLSGTGPFILTDVVEGSSETRTRNPDYWGHDEKYPQNQLPYIDELKYLMILVSICLILQKQKEVLPKDK